MFLTIIRLYLFKLIRITEIFFLGRNSYVEMKFHLFFFFYFLQFFKNIKLNKRFKNESPKFK